jgi:hypothetical protein
MLILYADGHEEPRKWARNRIREMKEDVLKSRVVQWQDEIKQPATNDLLSLDDIKALTQQLIDNAKAVSPENREQGYLDPIEKITPKEAYRSTEQLIHDLGENLTRADNRQTYLSACLFLFFAADELNRLKGNKDNEIKEIGGKLLRNYIATYVLVEKQIDNEQGTKFRNTATPSSCLSI